MRILGSATPKLLKWLSEIWDPSYLQAAATPPWYPKEYPSLGLQRGISTMQKSAIQAQFHVGTEQDTT